MRKVIYWDNILTEKKHSGFFHCWAGTMQDAYALIEDTTTGTMHRMNDNQFRFVCPPEENENQVVKALYAIAKMCEQIADKTEGI